MIGCLAMLGVVPVSCAARLPIVGQFFKSYCLECEGHGKQSVGCSSCFGRGYFGGRTCTSCGGTGKQESACRFCGGSGKKPKP